MKTFSSRIQTLVPIREWGQPLTKITHIIFYTTAYFGNIPSSDHHLAKLFGLEPTVKRLMIFNIGCHAGGTVLRIAKDIAEKNNAASVCLSLWVEIMAASFHGPNANHMDADPDPCVEFPLFELVHASQTTVPNTESAIHEGPLEMGLVYYLGKDIPHFVSENVDKCLKDAFNWIGVIDDIDWNSLFYAIHPGGPAILRKVKEKLGLSRRKLRASWHALSQYGNMCGLTVIFVLDEMRRWYKKEGKSTTGEGLEWGVLAGFGPGISMEIIVLRRTYI